MIFSTLSNKLANVYKNVTRHDAAANKSIRQDGWLNIMTGIGVPNSRVEKTLYAPEIDLTRNMLTALYKSDGIAKRIINIIVDDALRGFINCDIELKNELDRVKAKQRIIDAASWGRLYGGCALVAFIDDGQEMDKELNYKSIRKVISLKTFDRYQITWLQDDLSQNFYDEFYGEPEVFTITPYTGQTFRVHRSRMHIFNGDRTPNIEKTYNDYWDNSVLQSVYNALRNYGLSLNATTEIIQDFIQVVIGIKDLQQTLASPGGDEKVIKRAKLFDLTRSISKSVFVEADHESYTKHASSVSGLDTLLDKHLEVICAITGIPITKFGRSPGGMNATGKSDSDNHDNNVETYRTDEAAPCINWVINLLKAQSMWSSKDRPQSYEWEFPSLKPIDELQLAQIRLITAQTDAIYIDRGIPCPLLFTERYADGFFNSNIQIEQDKLEAMVAEEIVNETTDTELLEDINKELNKNEKAVNEDSTIETENNIYDELEKKRDDESSEEITDYIHKILNKRIAEKIHGQKQ